MKHEPCRAALTAKTQFAESQELGLNYVHRLNPDRLLAPCYAALGREPLAPNYGGWEARQIAGHSLGHYLSALAGFADVTGDARAKEKLDYAVARMKEIQRADGYLGGVPSTPFDDAAEKADFAVERFSLAGFWVPWYSVHKIYRGLIDAYARGGNEDALGVVARMADWAIARFADVGDEAFQRMLECEHGGMCAAFADLYDITGDARYLAMAERFIHREIIDPATRREDRLSGYHANTQIPKFIGLARLYELTGKAEYRAGAEFFFKTVLATQTYAIGGNSVGEHFQARHKEALGFDTCETCNTHNMMELAEHVFSWKGEAATADYYELALYNHILASQDPASGAKTYFMSTKSGTCRAYCSEENAFWCCTGTGMENPERYNRFICEDRDGVLYLNLFIDSTVTTADGWKLRIETAFPHSERVDLTVLAEGTAPRALKIRVPSWIDSGRRGESGLGEADEGGWWTAASSLEAGRRFAFSLPMGLHARRTNNGSGNFNVMYGPLALAADLGKEGMPASDILDDQSALRDWPAVPFPDFTGDVDDLESWITPVDGAPLAFGTASGAATNGKRFTLKPFYAIHHANYALYFTSADTRARADCGAGADSGAGVFSSAGADSGAGSDACSSDISGAGADGNAGADERGRTFATVDTVDCGRQQSEIDHDIAERGTGVEYIESLDRQCRRVSGPDGYLSYEMRFSPAGNDRVLVSAYGNDRGVLSVVVDGAFVASVSLDGTGGDKAVENAFAVGGQGAQNALGAQGADGTRGKRVVKIMNGDGSAIRVLELRVIEG